MIFLSYSWKDQAAAHAIDDWLRDHGFDVWIDFRQLDVQSDITHQLNVAIRDCSLFVAIRPTNLRSSPWMTAERLMAWKHFKPILQLMVGSTSRFPSSGNGDRLSVTAREVVRLLAIGCVVPFVVAGGRDQASRALESLAEYRGVTRK